MYTDNTVAVSISHKYVCFRESGKRQIQVWKAVSFGRPPALNTIWVLSLCVCMGATGLYISLNPGTRSWVAFTVSFTRSWWDARGCQRWQFKHNCRTRHTKSQICLNKHNVNYLSEHNTRDNHWKFIPGTALRGLETLILPISPRASNWPSSGGFSLKRW